MIHIFKTYFLKKFPPTLCNVPKLLCKICTKRQEKVTQKKQKLQFGKNFQKLLYSGISRAIIVYVALFSENLRRQVYETYAMLRKLLICIIEF